MASPRAPGCPNCGASIKLVDGACVCCWWREGEAHFRPHWMAEDAWRRGMMTGWMMSDKEARKLLEGKAR